MDASRRSLVLALGASSLVRVADAYTRALGSGAVAGPVDEASQAEAYSDAALAESWLEKTDTFAAVAGRFRLGRFADRMYFITDEIRWNADPGQDVQGEVLVPAGFVTDFASIPRAFWSLLPPDGVYTYAAVIHDYLYWYQERTREESDRIFKLAMQDLHVGATTTNAIHAAVRLAGGGAWRSNGKLRDGGERRILRAYPDDPAIRWAEWKSRPEVFADR